MEKQSNNLMHLPLIEERDVPKLLGRLKEILAQHGVVDPNEWNSVEKLVGEQFLEKALTQLEEACRGGEIGGDLYFKLLSWLTGSRIRVVDTAASPEWLLREYLPEMEEDLPTGMRAVYTRLLYDVVEEKCSEMLSKARDVKSAGALLAEKIRLLEEKIGKSKSGKRKKQNVTIVLQDLGRMRNWCGRLAPDYRQLPSPLKDLTNTLIPLGNLNREESEAFEAVRSALGVLETTHQFLVSSAATEKSERFFEALHSSLEEVLLSSEPAPPKVQLDLFPAEAEQKFAQAI